ncbi:MAG: hypothetical protein JWQ98_3551 [Chlorobi bacterium]|nr:hypothetical protein [Chlorobiota bacterium]
MTYAQAIGHFESLEADLAQKAIARGRTLVCDIAYRFDDATVGVLRLRSTSAGMISYFDDGGERELTREEFMAVYVMPDAGRLDAIDRARRNTKYARENIRSYIVSRRKYYSDAGLVRFGTGVIRLSTHERGMLASVEREVSPTIMTIDEVRRLMLPSANGMGGDEARPLMIHPCATG